MSRLLLLWMVGVALAGAAVTARAGDFFTVAQRCAPQVDPHTMAAIVSVESGYNPFAIGVVGGHLVRQPRTLDEALSTVEMLKLRDYNFSLGLAQINRHNLARLNESVTSIFEPCANLRAAASILRECFERAGRTVDDQQVALRRAISCFYSGNFSTGFSAGYVDRVVAHAGTNAAEDITPIPVVPDAPASNQPAGAAVRGAMVAAGAPTKGMRAPSSAHRRSRCSPGIVIVSECQSDGLANGSIKILH
jgi:type IV secretion system protein VirB1